MKTVRLARLVLPGSRTRHYEVEIVEQPGSHDARFLVNFRYGWDGGAVEEGTRTPDAVTEADAVRIYDSVIVARQKQGYELSGADVPERKKPDLVVVPQTGDPREAILGRRLLGLDTLDDKTAAALLRRVGELRLTALCTSIDGIARALNREGTRLAPLRALPYTLHRTDDGRGAVTELLEQLSKSSDTPTAETAQMLWALRDARAAPTWSQYPAVLQGALQNSATDVRDEAVLTYFQSAAARHRNSKPEKLTEAETALRMLYVHGAHDPLAREIFLATLRSIPLAPPLFRAIRRILQAVEATDDADVYALLNARFDNDRATSVRVLADAANPRLGYLWTYGHKTRLYWRRRGWRTLRRLGDNADAAYVTMAEAILLTLEDPAAPTAQDKPSREAEHPRRAERIIPAFADRYAAQKIMHGTSGRIMPSGLTLRWHYNGGPVPHAMTREEPYRDLWNAHPQGLWRVVTRARALDVAAFASRGLKDNIGFSEHVPVGDIAALLKSWQPFAPRLDLAIALAERRISQSGIIPELAGALIAEPTRGGALLKLLLAAASDTLTNDASLFAVLNLNCATENHSWFDPIAQSAAQKMPPNARREVLDRTLSGVASTAWSPVDLRQASALGQLLASVFPSEIAALEGQELRALSQQPDEARQLVAARLAAIHPHGASLVDVAALAASSNPELRAAGIAMFARRPIDALVGDLDAVAAFLTSNEKEPRVAARPIAVRIQNERPDAARTLAEKLLPTLYRTQDNEDLREDVLAVLSQDMRSSVAALGTETIWTLLRARAEPARRLGASVLDMFGASDFSIRQLARIGCNDQVIARRWAIAALESRMDDVRRAPEDAFALLDSNFEDARDAGYAMYRTHLQPEDWTPTALVALSDSTTEPAQRFGREMIGKVFEAKNADFLLSRLAEHPAPGFRLFVARLMRDYVQNDVQRLKKLVPAIATTLLQVRKGRAAKQQVLSFIEAQIAQDGPDRLAVLAPVLERVVGTCAIDDRARVLALLATIKQREPSLVPRVALVPREAR